MSYTATCLPSCVRNTDSILTVGDDASDLSYNRRWGLPSVQALALILHSAASLLFDKNDGAQCMEDLPSIAIAFPFMTLLCIPVGLFLAPRIFEGWER